MKFEWDAAKARINQTKHRVKFDIVSRFDFANALISVDDLIDHGEERLVATGLIDADVYVLVYVERPDSLRVISLRKATRREIEEYVQG